MDVLGMFIYASILASVIIVPLIVILLQSRRQKTETMQKPNGPIEATYWKEMPLYRYGVELLDIKYRHKIETDNDEDKESTTIKS